MPASRALLACALLFAAGCASAKPPQMLRIEPGRYQQAFDAALATAQHHGMGPELRDRRSGVIETQPARAPSWLEPFRGSATRESTVTLERRRARFEFVAAGAPSPPQDLSDYQGPVELRVWIIVDRAYAPGVRRDSWSRALTTRATITRPDSTFPIPSNDFWETLRRDPELELSFLEEVEKALR